VAAFTLYTLMFLLFFYLRCATLYKVFV